MCFQIFTPAAFCSEIKPASVSDDIVILDLELQFEIHAVRLVEVDWERGYGLHVDDLFHGHDVSAVRQIEVQWYGEVDAPRFTLRTNRLARKRQDFGIPCNFLKLGVALFDVHIRPEYPRMGPCLGNAVQTADT